MGEWKLVFVVFGIYFAGLWITLLVFGMINKCRSFSDLEPDVLSQTIIWPMLWAMWVVVGILMLIRQLTSWFLSTRVGKAVGFCLNIISLPFRPVAFGGFIRNRLDGLIQGKRFAKGRERDETMAAAFVAVEKEGI